ncbi:MAG TPA: hypothetical protein VFO25_02625 [Candidatus Eremiobacteraceae bacterium]|nr:hypothetical protein [Candidatus Eremiobacteraceae bacterium]
MGSRVLIALFFAATLAACNSHASSPVTPYAITPAAQVLTSPTATPGWSSFTYSGNIQGMTAGPDGAMWATMTDGSVSRIDVLGNQTSYAVGGVAQEFIVSLQGDLYVYELLSGGISGIAKVTTGGQVTDYPLSNDFVQSMAPAGVGLWMIRVNQSTGTYLTRMDTSGNTFNYSDTVGQGFLDIVQGADKNLWAAASVSGIVRISRRDGSQTFFSVDESETPYTLGSDKLLWTVVTSRATSVDVNGNSSNYRLAKNLRGFPQVATPHVIWWIAGTPIELHGFNTTTHRISKNIALPVQTNYSGPLALGPDKRLWAAINGTMYLYTIK